MLHGDRVYLRVLEQGDLGRTHQWINQPEVIEALSLSGPSSRQKQQQWFEGLCRDSSKIVFAICLQEDDRHIGNVSLRDIDAVHRRAMFSIFIADSSLHANGLGTEAARLALQYAFRFLNLHRVYLKTTADRAPAIAMYRRLGFTEEGRWRQHEFMNGAYVDKVLFGILAGEFDPPATT